MGFTAACFVWFKNTVYPSDFYGPTNTEASQSCIFLVRDQKLGANIASANFINLRQWLAGSHLILAFFFLVGHWQHAGRARATVAGFEKGINRENEPAMTIPNLD